VDDAGHPLHRVTGQRLGQRTDHRDGTRHGRLEIQVHMHAFGDLRQFSGGDRKQGLVRGDDGLATLQRGQNRFAGRFNWAHQFDNDVDVFSGNQFFDVVGEQLDRHTPVGGDPAYTDAAQRKWRTDSGGEVVGTVLDDADDMTADIAQSQYRYTDRFLFTVHVR